MRFPLDDQSGSVSFLSLPKMICHCPVFMLSWQISALPTTPQAYTTRSARERRVGCTGGVVGGTVLGGRVSVGVSVTSCVATSVGVSSILGVGVSSSVATSVSVSSGLGVGVMTGGAVGVS